MELWERFCCRRTQLLKYIFKQKSCRLNENIQYRFDSPKAKDNTKMEEAVLLNTNKCNKVDSKIFSFSFLVIAILYILQALDCRLQDTYIHLKQLRRH